MQKAEKLCLQWNDFKENVNEAFKGLRSDTEFTDVTLACEDGQQIEAHKVILSSFSPFFKNLLKKNKHPFPLIYMRGLKIEDLTAILDFLYVGEANVYQENLDLFLSLAEELKLKGLTGNVDVNESNFNDFVQEEAKKQPILNNESCFPTETHQMKITRPLVKGQQYSAVENTVAIRDQKVSVELDQLDAQIESMMTLTDNVDQRGAKLSMCTLCLKELTKGHMKDHIEANHINGVSHSCNICGKTARSRTALRSHKNTFHK